MTWWHLVLGGLGGLLLSALGGVAYAAWGEWGANRAAASVRGGRLVPVPVTVLAEEVTRGHAVRDGEEVRVITARHHLVFARAEFEASGIRRDRFDDDLAELAGLRGFCDGDGRRYLIGPPAEWEAGFEALLAAPASSAGDLRLLWAGVSRVLVGLAVAAACAAAVVQAVWWTGDDQRATVVRQVADPEGYVGCAVRWPATAGAPAQHYAEVDCHEPYPEPGAQVTVRALAWPFEGKAMDREGTYELLSILTLGSTALALGLGVGLGLRRMARQPVRLRGERGPAATIPRLDEERTRALPFRELVRTVAAREGWPVGSEGEPPRPSLRRQVTAAAGAAGSVARWWLLLPLAGLAGFADDLAPAWRAALVAALALLLLWGLARGVGVLLALRAVAGQPVGSEWDYLVVRTLDDEWLLFLLLGESPHWAVLLPDARPRPVGRCGVRGVLRDGGAVQLVIAGEAWVPAGPVLRVDDEFREEVVEDLRERLTGPLEDPEECPECDEAIEGKPIQ